MNERERGLDTYAREWLSGSVPRNLPAVVLDDALGEATPSGRHWAIKESERAAIAALLDVRVRMDALRMDPNEAGFDRLRLAIEDLWAKAHTAGVFLGTLS
jgi:hypothetical protein